MLPKYNKLETTLSPVPAVTRRQPVRKRFTNTRGDVEPYFNHLEQLRGHRQKQPVLQEPRQQLTEHKGSRWAAGSCRALQHRTEAKQAPQHSSAQLNTAQHNPAQLSQPGRQHVPRAGGAWLQEAILADATLAKSRYIARGTGKATWDTLFNFFS